MHGDIGNILFDSYSISNGIASEFKHKPLSLAAMLLVSLVMCFVDFYVYVVTS